MIGCHLTPLTALERVAHLRDATRRAALSGARRGYDRLTGELSGNAVHTAHLERECAELRRQLERETAVVAECRADVVRVVTRAQRDRITLGALLHEPKVREALGASRVAYYEGEQRWGREEVAA